MRLWLLKDKVIKTEVKTERKHKIKQKYDLIYANTGSTNTSPQFLDILPPPHQIRRQYPLHFN